MYVATQKALAPADCFSSLQCRRLLDGEQDTWRQYLASSNQATIYHRLELLNLLTDVFGHETYPLAAFSRQKLVGLLPLVRLRSLLFGDFLVSLPFFNYGGAIGEDDEVESALMQTASDIASDKGITHIEFRDEHPRDASWPCKTDKVTLERELPDNADALWKSIGSKLRSQVKRSKKEGASVSCGGLELLDDFYAVFAKNMRDLGTPVYPKIFFQRMMEAFPSETAIHAVHHGSLAVAAGLTIAVRPGVTEIPWASSLRDYNRWSVNMLLYWNVLERAIADGQKTFDFGRCSKDSGTYRFKKQWGAVERPLYWHYWLSPGKEMPALNPSNPKFQLAIRTWQRLPVWLTNLIGPAIVKYLP